MIIAVGPASAATYPAGGSTFTGSSENWQVKEATCSVPLLCEASGGYDGTVGNPPGSLAANSKILANAIGVLKATVVEESPSFTVASDGGGSSTLSLQRQFGSASELIALNSNVAYVANLVDRTAGTTQKAIEETIEGPSAFQAKTGGVTLIAGHTYAVQVTSNIATTLLSLNLLGGTASAHYDNVVVSGPGGGTTPGGGGNGGNGGEGGNGASGLTSSQLASLMQSQGLIGPATLSGNRISVKAKCPTKVGTTCKVTLQGLLKKGKPATSTRSAKIKQGKSKTLTLKVKPKSLSTVKAKKRLLFKITVKAGTAKATVYKSLKLIKK
jgi:hypothetical protein